MSESDTVEVNEDSMINYVLTMAREFDTVDWYVPDGMWDQVYDGLTSSNVDRIDSVGDGVEVNGSFHAKEQVGRRPASGGGKLEPPTNPPEAILEDREVDFVFRYYFEDLGQCDGRVEVL